MLVRVHLLHPPPISSSSSSSSNCVLFLLLLLTLFYSVLLSFLVQCMCSVHTKLGCISTIVHVLTSVHQLFSVYFLLIVFSNQQSSCGPPTLNTGSYTMKILPLLRHGHFTLMLSLRRTLILRTYKKVYCKLHPVGKIVFQTCFSHVVNHKLTPHHPRRARSG